MDARTLSMAAGLAEDRPLISRLDGMQQGHDSSAEREPANEQWVQMLAEFFRGGKEKRRQMLQAASQNTSDTDSDEEGEDKYEPQRLTRKIHWQYDRSMKKVPMLRRDYIG